MSSYWDSYEEAATQESGGGGIAGPVEVSTGYKVYIAGTTQEDTWFPANAGDRAERDGAKTVASKLGRPQWGIQIRVTVDGAVTAGKLATWQGDRFFNEATWTDACKDVIIPSLKNAGIDALPWNGYARIGFQPNPFNVEQGEAGKKDQDKDGNPRFPQVAYVVGVLSETEYKQILADAGGDDSAGTYGAPDLPVAWRTQPDAFKDHIRDNFLTDEFKNKPLPLRAAALNDPNVGATKEELEAWIAFLTNDDMLF